MSMTTVRSKFRSIMIAQGFTEWKDAFNEDIPNTIQHKAFQIQFRNVTGQGLNQHIQEIRCEAVIKFWYDGKRENWLAMDQVILLNENIIKAVIPASVRLAEPIKNILFNSFSIDPVDESNDNMLESSLSFTVHVILGV